MRRPGLWSICLTLFGLLLMLGLGVWQLQRMAWKNGLIAEMQAGMTAPPVFLEGPLDNLSALSYRAVRLRGQFLHDMEAHVGPRVHQGQAGLHVLTPLRLEDGDPQAALESNLALLRPQLTHGGAGVAARQDVGYRVLRWAQLFVSVKKVAVSVKRWPSV